VGSLFAAAKREGLSVNTARYSVSRFEKTALPRSMAGDTSHSDSPPTERLDKEALLS